MNSKQWARTNDNKLMELAMYHESQGMTVAVAHGERIFERFAEFKRYIMRGSFTLAEMEEHVYGMHGIQPPDNDMYRFLGALQKLSKDRKRNQDEQEPEK